MQTPSKLHKPAICVETNALCEGSIRTPLPQRVLRLTGGCEPEGSESGRKNPARRAHHGGEVRARPRLTMTMWEETSDGPGKENQKATLIPRCRFRENISLPGIGAARNCPLWDPLGVVTAVLLILLVFAAFSACLGNDFVTWDDQSNFLDNPLLPRPWLGADSLGLDELSDRCLPARSPG